MCGIVDSSYFPPRFILVGLCAYFIEALRVQRYEKFLIYANFWGHEKAEFILLLLVRQYVD